MTSGKDMWRHAAMRAAVSFMSAVDSSVSTSSLSAGIEAAASVLKWLPSERRMPLSASCFAIVACKKHGIAYSTSSCKSFIHNAYMLVLIFELQNKIYIGNQLVLYFLNGPMSCQTA